MELTQLLKDMIENNASDIFIVAGLPLSYKVSGQQFRTDSERLMPADTQKIVESIYEAAHRDIAPFMANNNHDEDFSFSLSGVGRFRANVFRQRGSLGAVIRVIPFGLPDPVKMKVPEEVLNLTRFRRGMVLVCGAAGSGKSTTLACMVDRLNSERDGHIVTMEDPIEYVHHHNRCIVTQREVPTDVATYAEALRSALREAPDIMLIGEMRDQETISTAVTAAEMSQLILSTLHTNSASATVNRIVETFPSEQQRQIRLQLSLVLHAVVAQQLVPTVDGGVTPAFEIMVVNPAIRSLIRGEKTHQIDSVIASSVEDGMRTMDQSLFDLVKDGVVDRDVALQHAIHTSALRYRLEDAGL